MLTLTSSDIFITILEIFKYINFKPCISQCTSFNSETLMLRSPKLTFKLSVHTCPLRILTIVPSMHVLTCVNMPVVC